MNHKKNITSGRDIVEIALATEVELAPSSLFLTFLVALGKLYPLREENMQWLNWKGPPPPPPPHTSSFSSVYVFQECSICLSVPVLSVSSGFSAVTRYLFLFLNCVALFFFIGHTIITPVLFFFVHSSSLPPSSQPSTFMPLYQPPSSGSPLSLPTAMLFSALHGGYI